MPLAHQAGEQPERVTMESSVVLDSFSGRIHVDWAPAAPVTALVLAPVTTRI